MLLKFIDLHKKFHDKLIPQQNSASMCIRQNITFKYAAEFYTDLHKLAELSAAEFGISFWIITLIEKNYFRLFQAKTKFMSSYLTCH